MIEEKDKGRNRVEHKEHNNSKRNLNMEIITDVKFFSQQEKEKEMKRTKQKKHN